MKIDRGEGEISAVSRAALGALGGLAATLVMTAAMRRLHQRLPSDERYPLPPREIVETLNPHGEDEVLSTQTLLAHFAYGALTGALYAVLAPRAKLIGGALYGVGVWCASYLGWIPALGILEPATHHPPRRNGLMLASHLVWGAATALSLRELDAAHRRPFAQGVLRDARSKSSLALASRVRPRRKGELK